MLCKQKCSDVELYIMHILNVILGFCSTQYHNNIKYKESKKKCRYITKLNNDRQGGRKRYQGG